MCEPELLFLCFAVEAKSVNGDEHSELQKMHSTGATLRNLRKLYDLAHFDDVEDLEKNTFNDQAKVLTLSFTR